MITRYLPKFNQMEPNLLLGLTAGQVVSQVPVDMDTITKVTKENVNFIENGILCTFSADGKEITNWTADGQPLFIHFTEELNTFLDERHYFAVEEAPKGENTYIRLVALTPGSEWTTTIAPDEKTYAAAIAANKIKQLYGTSKEDSKAYMPDGTKAYTYRCIAY